MSNAAPGWYTDPEDSRYHRWWDGHRWTEHTNRPVDTAPAPAHRSDADVETPRPKRRRALLFSLIGAAAAVALVVGGIAVVNGINSGAGPGATVEAGGYAWAPTTYLDVDEKFEIPMDVDPYALSASLGDERSGTHGVVDVYIDKDFTTSPLFPGVTWTESDPRILVSARDSKSYKWSNDVADLTAGLLGDYVVSDAGENEFTNWTEMDAHYIVQRYDREGKKLDVPIVHTVSSSQRQQPDGLGPIELRAGPGDMPGTVGLSWSEPAGMPEGSTYVILKTVPDFTSIAGEPGSENVRLDVIAETTETSWQPAPSEENESNYILNRELQLFQSDSVDDANFSGEAFSYVGAPLSKLSVIAVSPDKTTRTPIVITDLDSTIGSYPLHRALNQARDLFPPDSGDLSAAPTWYPITTLNGNTMKMPIRIDAGAVAVKYEDKWNIDGTGEHYASFPYSVLGTTLTGTITSVMPDGMSEADWHTQAVAFAEAFNQRATQEAPRLGDRVIVADDSMSLATYRKMDPVSEVPESPYEVYGSNEFTTYIAEHMLAGSESIDISAYLDNSAYPAVSDAAIEALLQNPMVKMSVDTYLADGDALYVAYLQDDADRDAVRAEVDALADDVVAEVVDEGMTDTEKVTAVNQWIVDNIEYDYAALQALEAGLSIATPGADMRVSDARGGLIDGSVICGGYTDTFNLLIRKAGLDSVYVSGRVEAGLHAWNHVKVDGEWKAVDTTWNDGGDPTEYLMINESEFTGTATRETRDGWAPAQFQHLYATP
ncbi:DUF2510 domain-containing protein [Microbacterium sp. NPDC058269]|uniref:transglutaminase domain-containing protein n=1 Tax=Microbacterium sp. NPDC058269 TaxID=3346414 RepID=UPI0036DC599B